MLKTGSGRVMPTHIATIVYSSVQQDTSAYSCPPKATLEGGKWRLYTSLQLWDGGKWCLYTSLQLWDGGKWRLYTSLQLWDGGKWRLSTSLQVWDGGKWRLSTSLQLWNGGKWCLSTSLLLPQWTSSKVSSSTAADTQPFSFLLSYITDPAGGEMTQKLGMD